MRRIIALALVAVLMPLIVIASSGSAQAEGYCKGTRTDGYSQKIRSAQKMHVLGSITYQMCRNLKDFNRPERSRVINAKFNIVTEKGKRIACTRNLIRGAKYSVTGRDSDTLWKVSGRVKCTKKGMYRVLDTASKPMLRDWKPRRSWYALEIVIDNRIAKNTKIRFANNFAH